MVGGRGREAVAHVNGRYARARARGRDDIVKVAAACVGRGASGAERARLRPRVNMLPG